MVNGEPASTSYNTSVVFSPDRAAIVFLRTMSAA